MPETHGFLVYTGTYDFEPSTTAALSPDPADDLRTGPGGEWVALDRGGNLTSRFADWSERE